MTFMQRIRDIRDTITGVKSLHIQIALAQSNILFGLERCLRSSEEAKAACEALRHPVREVIAQPKKTARYDDYETSQISALEDFRGN